MAGSLQLQKTSIMIGKERDHTLYGYLCMEHNARMKGLTAGQQKQLNENMKTEEIYRDSGIRVMVKCLVSTKNREGKDIELNYTRTKIEEVFQDWKKDGKMLPWG